MSEIRVNTIVAAEGTSAPNLPYGVQVPTGMGITGAGGVNITGVVTATSFSGSGAALTGLATTESVRAGTLTVAGVSTFTGALNATSVVSSGAVSGTTGTFSGAVNVDATTDSTSATSGALIVDGGLGIAKNVYIGAGLSVAGTLTYEDVTNVDSVGLITAKSGVNITGGQLQVGVAYSVGAAGVCTAAGFVGPLTGNVTGNASGSSGSCTGNSATATNSTNSSHVLVTDNESTDENNLITFVENGTSTTGNVGLEMDGTFSYNPSSGTVSATAFNATNLTGVLQSAGQTNVTSLGTLTGLTISGDVTFTGDSYDVVWDKSTDDLKFSDNATAKFGTGNDLSIYHNGTDSYIANDTGNLIIGAGNGTSVKLQPEGGENGLTVTHNGSVEAYYDNSKKFETTNDGTVTTGIGTFTAGANFDGILSEKFNTVAGKLSDNTTIDLEDGMIHFFTTTETATSTPNIRYSSSKTLNNMLTIGDTVSVTVITTAAAAGYSASWQVDGSAVTEEWNGAAAPSEGGSGGYDVYTITLLKTSNATFTVLANLSNFA